MSPSASTHQSNSKPNFLIDKQSLGKCNAETIRKQSTPSTKHATIQAKNKHESCELPL